MQLDPAALAAGVRLVTHEELGSTSAEAMALARAGTQGPLWITAGRQTAGRGRRGRAWVSEAGNLYASLLLTDPSPTDRAAELSFVAALAVHDAVVDVAQRLGPALAVKWPNDLLIGGRKVCGILIEGEGGGARPLSVAVGIGVNCTHHPDEIPSTDLAAAGALVSAAELFRALSATMLRRLAQWNRGAGFAATRRDWLARAAGIGDDIRVRLPDRELVGRFETLDEAGHLVLRLPDGSIEPIAAGEVFVLAGGSAFSQVGVR